MVLCGWLSLWGRRSWSAPPKFDVGGVEPLGDGLPRNSYLSTIECILASWSPEWLHRCIGVGGRGEVVAGDERDDSELAGWRR